MDYGGRDHQRLDIGELSVLLQQICNLSKARLELWYEPESQFQSEMTKWHLQQEEERQEERQQREFDAEEQLMQDGTEWEQHNGNVDEFEEEQVEDGSIERPALVVSSTSSSSGRPRETSRRPPLIQTKRSFLHSKSEDIHMELKWKLKSDMNRSRAARKLGQLIEDLAFTIARKCDARSFVNRHRQRKNAVKIMTQRLEALALVLENLSDVSYSDASVLSWMLNSSEAVLIWLHDSDISEAERMKITVLALKMARYCQSMLFSPRPSWLQAVESISLPAISTALDKRDDQYLEMICMLSSSIGPFSQLHRPSQTWLRTLSDESQHNLGSLSSIQITSLVKGLVDLGSRVPSQTLSLKWLQSLEEATSVALRGNSYSPEEIVILLDSIARITSPSSSSSQSSTSLLDVVMLQDGNESEDDDYFSDPTESAPQPTSPYAPANNWLDSLYSAVSQHHTFTVPQQTKLVSGLNSLRCRPNGQWLNEMLVKSRRTLAAADAGELADLIDSLASLRFRASEGWLQYWLSAVFHKLPYASPAQCCLMVRCLAKLNHRPPRLWMEELSSQLQGRLHLFQPNQLSDIAVALVQLGLKPSESFLRELERVCDGSMIEKFSGAELTGLAWALAQMSWAPQVSWTYSFVLSAYKRLDSFNSQQLGVLFEALPKISPQLTSLDELVQIVASENQKRPVLM